MNHLFSTAIILLVTAFAHGIELDSNGCRVLSELPPPGAHPRVFFTADEYPRMRERLNAPHFKPVFGPVRRQIIAKVRNEWGDFAETDLSNPSDEEILQYFTTGEGRNINWGVASLTAVLTEDEELLELMKKVIVNYAHVILASRQRAFDNDLLENRSSGWM